MNPTNKLRWIEKDNILGGKYVLQQKFYGQLLNEPEEEWQDVELFIPFKNPQPEPPKEREPEKPKCETYLEKIRREERERTLSEILNIIKEKLNVSER